MATAEQGNRCPGLAELQAEPLSDQLEAHVASCESCQDELDLIRAARAAPPDCERFELLFAMRADGTIGDDDRNLLERHVGDCADCQAIEDTFELTALGSFMTLPNVDPVGYQVGRVFARGGMGKVFDAFDLRIGRPVAIKELRDRSPQLALRFEREARLTARLQHPGIIPIYEIGTWPDGTPHLVMRKVEGEMLEDSIARTPTLVERLGLLPSMIAVCETIAFAHSRCVIHRDLKPSNILLGAYGETVVIDWGLAKDLTDTTPEEPGTRSEPSDGTLTNVGAVLGTYAYMPPEQANGEVVDERADVYALGAILYHLLAGARPYRALDGVELRDEVRRRAPQPIREAARAAAPDLISIVEKAMSREPENRYRSAAGLAADLRAFQTGRIVEAHTYSTAQRMTRFFRRNRAAVTITTAAVIVLALVAFASVRNILRSKNEARATARSLLLEEGRVELLAGRPLRALAYLHEAEQQGVDGSMLRVLLGQALSHLDSASAVECGSDDRLMDVGGDMVAAACFDRARIWQITPTGLVEKHAFPRNGPSPGGFVNVKFSHDAKTLATWGERGFRLWDVASGRERPVATSAKASSINAAAFTPNDDRIATFDESGYARVYDLATGRELLAIAANQNPIEALRRIHGTIDRDGSRLLTVSFTGQARAFSMANGAELGTYDFGGLLGGGDISADGSRAVICRTDGVVDVIDTSGALLHEFSVSSDIVWKCMFNTDGTRVVVGTHQGFASVWDVSGKDARVVTTIDVGDVVWGARFSPDGERFVTITPGKHMKVWDTTSGDLLGTYGSRGKDAWFLPDHRLVATRGDGSLEIWSATTVRPAAYSPPVDAAVVGVTPDVDLLIIDRKRLVDDVDIVRPDGRVVATLGSPVATSRKRVAGTANNGISILEPAGSRIAWLPVHPRPARIAMSADGARLAAMWSDRAEIWDVASARLLVSLPAANHVVLSADGARAITWVETDTGVHTQPVVWAVATAQPIVTLPAIDAIPIGFALGGERAVVVELATQAEPMLSIWDATSGQPVRQVPKVAIHPTIDPSGRWVTSVDQLREVAVWDVEDGSQRSSFAGDQLQQAQANDDGTLLVAIGNYGRAVFILNAADGRVLAQHALDHARSDLRPNRFVIPAASAWWSSDSSTIASLGKGVSVWNASNPFARQAASLIRKHVPYNVENGQLVPKKYVVTGRVSRGDAAVDGARVVLSTRRAADESPTEVSWDTMAALKDVLATHTDDDGDFEIDVLARGELDYAIAVEGTTCTIDIGPDAPPIEIDLTTKTCRP